jgi:dTDP-4-amino-4,6-dideoxygalactose transaminase
MNIQFVDLKSQYLECKQDIDSAIQQVLNDGNYILGNQVKLFEDEFAKYCGVTYGVGVSSGLSAIELALKTFGITKGDEVIIPSNTFIASALPITSLGATVVLCEVNPDTQLMDVSKLEVLITGRTKAIMPVHLFGQIVPNMAKIMALCIKYDLFLIEDASQAHGASQDGRKAGSWGDISCFSLYPAKNLGAIGDSGIAITTSKDYYEKMLSLRNYGSVKKYYHNELGTNARLDTINASVLSIKLKALNKWNSQRNYIANMYHALLRDVGDIVLPKVADGNYSVYHLFVIKTKFRDELQKFLAEKNIGTVIHYPIPIHLQECYKGCFTGNYPITEQLANEILSLPMHPYLTVDEVGYICTAISSFYKNKP